MAHAEFRYPLDAGVISELRKIAAAKEPISPKVGVHLRTQDEADDLSVVLQAYRSSAIYIGMVGSRTVGKITRSAEGLIRNFQAMEIDVDKWSLRQFQQLSKDLPRIIGSLPPDTLFDFHRYLPGIPQVRATDALYDIDVVLILGGEVRKGNGEFLDQVIGPKGTEIDLWFLDGGSVLRRPPHFEGGDIFDNSKRLFP